MAALTSRQILRILELTDSLNLHREAVLIPLTTEEKGSVTILSDGRLRITVAKDKPFEECLAELRNQLGRLDLSPLRKTR
jgi:hypothetical protein